MLEMKVPSPGESITEVEIAQWLVSNGDYVEKDQPIAEVDSDKATLELPAEDSGIITLKAEEGDTVEVGQVICLIDTDAKKTKESLIQVHEKKQEPPKKVDTKTEVKTAEIKNYASGTPSPAAKKILNEKVIDANTIMGTGKDGRITKEDAIKGISSMGRSRGHRGVSTKKLSVLRRKVAERLVTSKNQTAMLTTFNEVDMSPIFSLRNEYKDSFKARHGVGLGFMSFFTLAVVRALKLYPDVNSMINGQNKLTYDYYDISIAVSGPKGLMVPVIRNAENLTFRGVEQEVKRLALRARDGEITLDEMTGGTFTITNGGVFGSMLSTPIINPPQSGILGMHNIVERPVAVNGKVEIRPVMYIALSYDHRIIDGRESVGFLVAVKEAIENPKEHLMEENVQKALEL
ncbi:dihydrolipoyllysine-residue succinyltransferase component of 2-oxoglutarate dehydrogenase complex [Elysia marginata]|uniref:Dihydrolipoyllysine-residue succinyltransferase component of 2-oxoglutarate dehydrogenase complex n=1 Tax=Elysia marginata TaxID=1093978 RepID=A0AAV4I564_9GAST|nr:dihydrolipoyllysine-residue succinyltransferase component of 2-oxoglutarate dehydrogenase complex [Elysia marginata]